MTVRRPCKPLSGRGSHDGRTSDLLQAIPAHASNGSEANGAVGNFKGLPASTQHDILNFPARSEYRQHLEPGAQHEKRRSGVAHED